MTPATKAQWQIHACVVLWGFTAILGKLITLPAGSSRRSACSAFSAADRSAHGTRPSSARGGRLRV